MENGEPRVNTKKRICGWTRSHNSPAETSPGKTTKGTKTQKKQNDEKRPGHVVFVRSIRQTALDLLHVHPVIATPCGSISDRQDSKSENWFCAFCAFCGEREGSGGGKSSRRWLARPACPGSTVPSRACPPSGRPPPSGRLFGIPRPAPRQSPFQWLPLPVASRRST